MVNQIIRQSGDVAPLAGARIEIGHYGNGVIVYRVAPLAGARIEMISRCPLTVWLGSLPSRERGLKYFVVYGKRDLDNVAPLAGARIEI